MIEQRFDSPQECFAENTNPIEKSSTISTVVSRSPGLQEMFTEPEGDLRNEGPLPTGGWTFKRHSSSQHASMPAHQSEPMEIGRLSTASRALYCASPTILDGKIKHYHETLEVWEEYWQTILYFPTFQLTVFKRCNIWKMSRDETLIRRTEDASLERHRQGSTSSPASIELRYFIMILENIGEFFRDETFWGPDAIEKLGVIQY